MSTAIIKCRFEFLHNIIYNSISIKLKKTHKKIYLQRNIPSHKEKNKLK